MRRFFDILTSISVIILLLPILILIFLSVKYYSKDSTIFWSERAGINNQPFKMPKFRTMIENTPLVVCYKLNPISWIIAKTITNIKYTAMVNLIANDSVVAECLQGDMNSSRLANELLPLLNLESEERNKMLPKLESVKKDLGSPGVYGRVATAILERTKFK